MPTVLASQCAPGYEPSAPCSSPAGCTESRNAAVRVWGCLGLSSLPGHRSPCTQTPAVGTCGHTRWSCNFPFFLSWFLFCMFTAGMERPGLWFAGVCTEGTMKVLGLRGAGQGQTLGAVLLLTPQPLPARTTHTPAPNPVICAEVSAEFRGSRLPAHGPGPSGTGARRAPAVSLRSHPAGTVPSQFPLTF